MPTSTERSFVLLSRRAARVMPYLSADAQNRFRAAVTKVPSIDALPEPFRTWMKDVRRIPAADRSRVLNPRTNQMEPRKITRNLGV